jgi:hypothetical protein
MKTLPKISLALFLLLSTTPAWAALSPLSINIVPPAQFPPSDYNV